MVWVNSLGSVDFHLDFEQVSAKFQKHTCTQSDNGPSNKGILVLLPTTAFASPACATTVAVAALAAAAVCCC